MFNPIAVLDQLQTQMDAVQTALLSLSLIFTKLVTKIGS